MDYRIAYASASNYVIALQRAIEYYCKGKLIPDNIANKCPHHAAMLNRHLTTKSSGQDNVWPCRKCGGDAWHREGCDA